jgi:lactate permease
LSAGPILSPLNWLLASLPIVLLMGSILVLGWKAPRAGALSLITALALGWMRFGADFPLLALASAKGLSFSFFVLSIIWAAVFLYNLLGRLQAMEVVGRGLTSIGGNSLGIGILIAWPFAGFIQGITGFGVPVAAAVPLLLLAGVTPVRAVTAALVGHSWAVTFGSLGSSYYTIELASGIPGDVIGPHMALLFVLPIVTSGLAVAHILNGLPGLRQGAPLVLIVGAVMSFIVWATAELGAPQVASVTSGLGGCAATWVILRRQKADSRAPSSKSTLDSISKPMGFHLAFLSYYLLIALSLIAQIPIVREVTATWVVGLDYPATETSYGYTVAAVQNYAGIRLVGHPAPLILAATLLTLAVMAPLGHWRTNVVRNALATTYRQSLATSVGVAGMVMMALVMIDTGMIVVLASGMARATGTAFPLVSPFLGVLGTFLTGSNTNSNIMFGAIQVEAARALDISAVTLAATQSIGGSLGSAIAPAKVLVGTTLTDLRGNEATVMRRALPYCLFLVGLVGVQAWIITKFF